ncbi:Di-copper centre-containing protein [Aaosphaeria arxii CBS 175.79]|uniref:Di-copper centre-containing protein n=1 Tax=Aaosphaeria arxii CBS 175.79 TaxID=1450172 RepID=A0A6A5XM88_9PLEO|nr:Di-copper centre-containing protein [Aaosphaeria arxii CBS 175.79]KAF2014063.1 Di-copper centre-containing protein [Aaosphaeria arxii CBS 175.79]
MNALGSSKGNCSSKNALIRRSWSRISDDDRKDYLSAIGCINRRLQNTIHDEGPTIHTDALRFRIDDFVLVHTEWSYLSLFSGTYFHWHRWFLHLYETALRDECGYTGTLPYWDFSEYADDITTDPIFSGDSVSMGGNGAAKSHGWVRVNYFDEKFMVPPGDGGGCVSTPLENYTARLGLPLVYDTDTAKTTDHPWPTYDAAGYVAIVKNNGYDWNDRCITRDLSPWIGQLLEASRIEYDLSCPDFECLMNRINGLEPAYRYIQNLVNTARFAVGGLQLDPLTAPNDPIFWLIQSNIDRLFSVWQGQDLEARVNQTAGKHNPWNRESEHPYHGDPVRLDEDLTIGPIDQIWTRSTGDFSSTIDGPLLCYYYDSH